MYKGFLFVTLVFFNDFLLVFQLFCKYCLTETRATKNTILPVCVCVCVGALVEGPSSHVARVAHPLAYADFFFC